MAMMHDPPLGSRGPATHFAVIGASGNLPDAPRRGLPVAIPRDQVRHWTAKLQLEIPSTPDATDDESIHLEAAVEAEAVDAAQLSGLVNEVQIYNEALNFTTDPDERDDILSQRNAAEQELDRLAPASALDHGLLAATADVGPSHAECDPRLHDWFVVVSAQGPQVLRCQRCDKVLGVESTLALETDAPANEICAEQGHDWRARVDDLARAVGVECSRCHEQRELAADSS